MLINKQELGKIYLIEGTEICKNGGAGVSMRNVHLEIDQNSRTIIKDNDYGFQVYVMLKNSLPLMTGFEKAIV